MPNRESGLVEFYPAFCFHLSPTYNDWVRLSAANVHGLDTRPGFEGQGLYFHINHPIRYVRLVGIIVAFNAFPTRFVFVIDDFSGATIDVTCEKPTVALQVAGKSSIKTNDAVPAPSTCGRTISGTNVDFTGIEVGTVVKVKGSISKYRDQRQVSLERLWEVKTTNEEASNWTENCEFYDRVLARPWFLNVKEVRRAQKKAAGHSRKGQSTREKKRSVDESTGPNHLRAVSEGQEEAAQRTAEVKRQKKLRDSDRAERERAYKLQLARRAKPASRPKSDDHVPDSVVKVDKRALVQSPVDAGVSEQSAAIKLDSNDNAHRIKLEKTQRAREADKKEREKVFAMTQARLGRKN